MGLQANKDAGFIAIGKVRTSYGVKGEMKALSFSGEVSHFKTLITLTLSLKGRVKEYRIEYVRIQGNTPILKLEGINAPEEAKRFSGAEILVPRENAAPLKKGDFYHADLCRCHLIYQGEEVGRVVSVVPGGNGELLEVEKNDSTRVFIPFHKLFVGKIDIKKLSIELLEGNVLE